MQGLAFLMAPFPLDCGLGAGAGRWPGSSTCPALGVLAHPSAPARPGPLGVALPGSLQAPGLCHAGS